MVDARHEGLDVTRLLAEQRNPRKYGNRVGPGYEQVVARGAVDDASIVPRTGHTNATTDVVVGRLGALSVVVIGAASTGAR